MDNWNYPEGADNSSAPWNQSDEEKSAPIQVTCSNTLSKDFLIDAPIDEQGWVQEDCNLEQIFQDQEYSAKESFDLAIKYSKEAIKLAELLQKKYPNIARKLAHKANTLWGACDNWNEDELEVVTD